MAENIIHTYGGSLMLPSGLAGVSGYWSNAIYDDHGRFNYMIIGGAPNTANVTYTYDDHTSWLKSLLVKRDNTTPASTNRPTPTTRPATSSPRPPPA